MIFICRGPRAGRRWACPSLSRARGDAGAGGRRAAAESCQCHGVPPPVQQRRRRRVACRLGHRRAGSESDVVAACQRGCWSRMGPAGWAIAKSTGLGGAAQAVRYGRRRGPGLSGQWRQGPGGAACRGRRRCQCHAGWAGPRLRSSLAGPGGRLRRAALTPAVKESAPMDSNGESCGQSRWPRDPVGQARRRAGRLGDRGTDSESGLGPAARLVRVRRPGTVTPGLGCPSGPERLAAALRAEPPKEAPP